MQFVLLCLISQTTFSMKPDKGYGNLEYCAVFTAGTVCGFICASYFYASKKSIEENISKNKRADDGSRTKTFKKKDTPAIPGIFSRFFGTIRSK